MAYFCQNKAAHREVNHEYALNSSFTSRCANAVLAQIRLNQRFPGFLALILLGACSSTSPTTSGPAIHYLEQDALYAMKLNLDDEAENSLLAALNHYQSIDDLDGQWRMHYLMTTSALAIDDLTSATQHASHLEQLSNKINKRKIRYRTSLLLGQIRDDSQYFQSALASANTPLERAIAATYLGNTSEAISLLDKDNIGDPADRAFIYYQHAKKVDSEQYFHLALDEYKTAQDSRGVSDALVNLALLSAKNGRTEQAKDYGRRASRALSAAGLKHRAIAIDAWLSTL